MPSFRELQERYFELVKLSHEELVQEIGSWWAELFEKSKDELKIIAEGRKNGR